MDRLAVIDMGSNSFRLVVFEFVPGRHWREVDEIREAVRIGAGMGEEARLRPRRIDRAVRTATVFDSFCRASGIDDVTAVATSAIRDAANRHELLDAIETRTSLEVRVLDALEEARYGYLAIANSTTVADGFGIDIGGGSVQLMRLAGRDLADAGSWPLGAVRASEAFLPGEEAGKRAMKALRKHVARELRDADWLDGGDGARLAGIGGTIRNLATATLKRRGVDAEAGGLVLERTELEELIEVLAARPASKRGQVPGIRPDRGDLILGGALVLAEVMERGGFAGVEVSESGLREGIFFERLLAGRARPLFEDVRRQSVLNLAHHFVEEPTHLRHVAMLCLEIHDGLVATGAVEGDPGDRELLWAAGMLHDIGVAIDYHDHHKHSRYLILNAGLPGFTPREVALVACVARYHRRGDPQASDLGPLAEPGDERRLAFLSGILRLAEQLERSRDQSIEAVSVDRAGGGLRMRVSARRDASVALWSARQGAGLLERAVGRGLDITAR